MKIIKKISIPFLFISSTNVSFGRGGYSSGEMTGVDYILFYTILLYIVYAVFKTIFRRMLGKDDDSFGRIIVWYVHMLMGVIASCSILGEVMLGKQSIWNNFQNLPIELIYIGAVCSIFHVFISKEDQYWFDYIFIFVNVILALKL